MLKRNKVKCIISSVLILLPMVLGIVFWEQLPDMVPNHFGADGQADSMGSKAVFIWLPMVLFAMHWFCLVITAWDPKNKNQSPKAFNMIFYIMPALSWLTAGIIFAAASGYPFEIACLLPLFLGGMFLLMGNLMPKVRQNSTFGIKIKWTLANEENWNATHRFGGKVWAACGAGMLLCALLPANLLMYFVMGITVIAVILPAVFSYRFYKKQVAAGTAPEKAQITMPGWNKGTRIISIVMILVILAVIVVVMFTGEITVTYGEDSFTLNATYWEPVTVSYDAIVEMGLRQWDMGMKVNGFNSARMNLGTFQNDEAGNYTVFAYTGQSQYLVIYAGGNTLVLSGPDEAATVEMFNTIMERK